MLVIAGILALLLSQEDPVKQGRALYEKKEYREAIKLLNDVIAKDPKNWRALETLSFAHKDLGEPNRALDYASRVIAIIPKNSAGYFNRALLHQRLKNYADALKDLNEFLRLGGDEDGYYERGRTYWLMDQAKPALKDAETYLARAPQDANAHWLRGVIYVDMKGWDDAIRDLSRCLELNPKHTSVHHNRGLCYLNKDEYDRAIADFDRALEIDPRNALFWRRRGVCYDYKRDYDRAIADYDRCLDIDPKDDECFRYRGLCRYYKNDFDRAISDFTQAIQLKPDNPANYHNRSTSRRRKGDLEGALADIEVCVLKEPESAVFLYTRALDLALLGRYEASLRDCNASILKDADGQLTQPRVLAALDLAAQGNVDAGLFQLRKGMELPGQEILDYYPLHFDAVLKASPHPDAVRTLRESFDAKAKRGARLWKASEQVTAGKLDPALAELNSILQEDPDLSAAYTWRAEVYLKKADYEKALPDCRRFAEAFPKFAGAYEDLGRCCDALRRDKEAEAAYLKAVEYNPENPNNENHLGRMIWRLGRFKEALVHIERAIKLDPQYKGALWNRAALHEQMRNVEAAKAALRKYLEIYPEDIDGLKWLPELCLDYGHIREAIDAASALIKVDPKNARGYYLRARGRLGYGDYERATQDYETAKGLDPKIPFLDLTPPPVRPPLPPSPPPVIVPKKPPPVYVWVECTACSGSGLGLNSNRYVERVQQTNLRDSGNWLYTVTKDYERLPCSRCGGRGSLQKEIQK